MVALMTDLHTDRGAGLEGVAGNHRHRHGLVARQLAHALCHPRAPPAQGAAGAESGVSCQLVRGSAVQLCGRRSGVAVDLVGTGELLLRQRSF